MPRFAAMRPLVLLRAFALVSLALGYGCAGIGQRAAEPVHYRFFDPPEANDIWTPTIRSSRCLTRRSCVR